MYDQNLGRGNSISEQELHAGWKWPWEWFKKEEPVDLSDDEIVRAVLKNTFPGITPPQEINEEMKKLVADMLWVNAKQFNVIDKIPIPATPPSMKWVGFNLARAIWNEYRDTNTSTNRVVRMGLQGIFKTPYEWVRQGGEYSYVRPNFSDLDKQSTIHETGVPISNIDSFSAREVGNSEKSKFFPNQEDGKYRDPDPLTSSAPQQSSSYGQLLAAQRFMEQHLKTKPQLPSNQEVDDLLAKLSPLRAELTQLQQVEHIATMELKQLEQRGERSILNPLGYSDRQHDQVFYVWQRASDAVYGQNRENDYFENRVAEYAQTIRNYQQWEQQPETSQMRQIQQLLTQPEMQSQLAFAQRHDALFHQSLEAATALDQPPLTPDTVRAMHSTFLTEGSLLSEEQMVTLTAMTDQHQALLAQQQAATPDLAVLGA